jgi:DNA-binding MarR family transcriptional regulator
MQRDKPRKTVLPPGPTANDQRDMNLFTLLVFTQDTLSKAREKELKFYDLTLTRARILHILCEKGGGCSVLDMANWCSREKISMLALISRMEKDGLIEKQRSDREGKKLIKITSRGRQLYAGVQQESIKTFFSVLSSPEKKQLETILNKLRIKAREILGSGFKSDYIS